MKFDKVLKIIEEELVSDGMGGFIPVDSQYGDEVLGNIEVFAVPVKAEIMLKEYGIVSTKSYKMFTKSYIPSEHTLFRDSENNVYKILQLSDYGKFKMLLVEVVSNDTITH